ncbi:MAG: class II fructose-bisphosphatase [Candidatus Hydrogenedentota bacterium]|nr:MAG: class II fructose-bisphosphatase [Candidatus Hydrogenedentota bacterium]
MDRNLALEFVRVTEAAALSAARWMGRGDEKGADQAAVDAMRKAFNIVDIDGTIVIGEGERDEAPMLYIGEEVGTKNGPRVDIALDPLEGTTITANGGYNATSVIAVAEKGRFLHAPDTYMDKLAVGPQAKGMLNIEDPVEVNLKRLAKALDKYMEDIVVCILDRPRHEELIKQVRAAGCRIKLISDGDVSGALACCMEDSPVDILLGIGGAPEGVLSAAALKCLGGDFQGRLKWRNEEEKERAKDMGITDPEKVYTMDELAGGHVMFCATGVTDGEFLKGVHFTPRGAKTHSMVMRSKSRTIRWIHTEHHFDYKPTY